MATADTIKQYFQNILMRDPTAAESTQYTGAVDTGALTLTQVRDALAASSEATTYVDQIIRIYQAAFGRKPDVTGIDGWTDQLRADPTALSKTAAGFVNSTEWKNRYGDNTVNDAVLQALYVNVLGRTGSGAEIAAWKATGQSMTQILIGFSNSQEFITKSASAVMAIKQAAAGVATADLKNVYTGSGALFDPSAGSSGSFTLTTGTDYADGSSSFKNGGLISSDFKFTSGNQTVTAGASTLNTADALIDVSTSDNDVLNVTAIGAVVTPTALQNIENVNLTINTAGAGINLTNAIGVKAISVTGIANGTVEAIDMTKGTTVAINNYNSVATVQAATLAGTTAGKNAEALSVSVSGAGTKAGLTLTSAVAGVLETLTVDSTGSAKNTLAVTLGANANGITTTNITGAADLDYNVATAVVSGQTLDASKHTGKLNLGVDRNGATTAVTNLTNATGVDIYTFTDSTAGGDALVASGLADAAAVVLTYGTAGASSLAVKGAASSTTNSLTLTLDHATDATDIAVATSLTIADVETINIVSEGGTTTGSSIAALTVDAGSKVVVSGATKLDLQLAAASKVATVEVKGAGAHKVDFDGASAYAEGKNLTIDGSTATGKLTLDGSDFQGTAGGAVEAITIKGGTNDDTITGTSNANAKNVIDGGAGKDTISVSTANNSAVTLGAGEDTLSITGVTGAGKVSISDFVLGAGGDKLSVDTNAAMTLGGVGATAVNNQLIIRNAAVADATAAAAAVQGTIGANHEKAMIMINNATGVAELWYFRDANGGGTADAGETVLLASFDNITTVGALTDATSGFVAANFGTWA